jgi:hypothetical protein
MSRLQKLITSLRARPRKFPTSLTVLATALLSRYSVTFQGFIYVLVFLALSSLCTSCGPSGKDRTYQAQAMELINSIEDLLTAEKVCKDRNDCGRQDYALWSSGKGVYIYVYGIRDQAIVKNIVSLCLDAHMRNPKVQYELNMHSQTKRETVEGSSKTKTLQLVLPRED